MVISEKSTLGVHEVGDGHGVKTVSLGGLRVEHDIGTAHGASTEVLLAESLHLLLNGSTSLLREVLASKDLHSTHNCAPKET